MSAALREAMGDAVRDKFPLIGTTGGGVFQKGALYTEGQRFGSLTELDQ